MGSFICASKQEKKPTQQETHEQNTPLIKTQTPAPICSKSHRASFLLHQENRKRASPRGAEFPGNRDPEHRRTESRLGMMRHSGHKWKL